MDKVNIAKKIVILVLIVVFMFLSVWGGGYGPLATVLVAMVGGFVGFSIGYLIFKIPKMSFEDINRCIMVATLVAFSVSAGTVFGYTSIYALIAAIIGIIIGIIIVKLRKASKKYNQNK